MLVMASLSKIVSTHPRVEKQVDVLMEKSLILLISCTKVLQELMSQFHDVLHSDIFTLKCKREASVSYRVYSLVKNVLWKIKNKNKKEVNLQSLIHNKNDLHLLIGDLQEL